jgi:HemY protein
MARIESGELGDKGREREWLARALRAPRDRAWIADGYVSDRWLPVSPVTGAVDAFEWKAPVDAIGRGDDTLIIEERPEPVTASAEVLAPFAPPRVEPARVEKPVYGEIVEMSPKTEAAEAPPPVKRDGQEAPRSAAEQRLRPAIFVPDRPPDDPGVAQTETDESPNSLERLRAAQIR